MTAPRRVLALFAVLVAGGLGALPADAARLPTERERAAILRASPPYWRTTSASACVAFVVRVSNNGRYARIKPAFLRTPRCARYASDGAYILRRGLTRWRIVFEGSDPPPCALRVPRDLTPCLR